MEARGKGREPELKCHLRVSEAIQPGPSPVCLGLSSYQEEKVTSVHGEGFSQGNVNFWVLSAVKTTKIPRKCLSSNYWKLNPSVIMG